jgi:hypothetical protein
MLMFDALTMDFRKVSFKKRESCALCGTHPSILELVDEEQPVCDLKNR